MTTHKFSRNTLKLFAFLFMFIDHVGAIFFPAALWYRTIGRLSFPLFAYLIADGMGKTHHQGKMIARLLIFALISQIPYSLAFTSQLWSWNLNVFFTLAFGAVCCLIIRQPYVFKNINTTGQKVLKALLIFLCAGFAYVLHTDYSCYGVLMIAFLYHVQHSNLYMKFVEIQKYLLFFALFILTFLYAFFSRDFLQMSCALSGLLMPHSQKHEKPWGIWAYCIYPLHLLLFWQMRKM
jgi:hypothetical protein